MVKWEKLCWLWIWDKANRKVWRDAYRKPTHYNGSFIYCGLDGCDRIAALLARGKPCIIGRFGVQEISITSCVFDQKGRRRIRFPEKQREGICNLSGFFPKDDVLLTRFGCEMLDLLSRVDILAVWHFKSMSEKELIQRYSPQVGLVDLASLVESTLECDRPWTRMLKGKRVLVIHPFVKTIRMQYAKREKLFPNSDVLPEFELLTIKVVQGLGDRREIQCYRDWFDALAAMCRQIDRVDFDVAIIGAGAYGLFLADYVKRIGKQAIHTAGATQLLFGIKGHRWIHEQPDFAKRIFNEHWVFPLPEDTPTQLDAIVRAEDSLCYW